MEIVICDEHSGMVYQCEIDLGKEKSVGDESYGILMEDVFV